MSGESADDAVPATDAPAADPATPADVALAAVIRPADPPTTSDDPPMPEADATPDAPSVDPSSGEASSVDADPVIAALVAGAAAALTTTQAEPQSEAEPEPQPEAEPVAVVSPAAPSTSDGLDAPEPAPVAPVDILDAEGTDSFGEMPEMATVEQSAGEPAPEPPPPAPTAETGDAAETETTVAGTAAATAPASAESTPAPAEPAVPEETMTPPEPVQSLAAAETAESTRPDPAAGKPALADAPEAPALADAPEAPAVEPPSPETGAPDGAGPAPLPVAVQRNRGRRPLSRRVARSMGASPHDRSHYRLVGSLFLRMLALVYLAAFYSIGIQMTGLVGSEGLFPLAPDLAALKAQYGTAVYALRPMVFWYDASDLALRVVPAVGSVAALLLFLNWLPRLSLVAAFVCYLSLTQAAPQFLDQQWDHLLLEVGFLSFFLASGPSRIVLWLYRWLLFRVLFMAGAAKVLSGDPAWANLTALSHYFETQALPHPGAWFAHTLTPDVLQMLTGVTLFVQLVVPFMILLPRGPRFLAAWAIILLQLGTLATGNHAHLSVLTLVLCLFLFDDRAAETMLPRWVVAWVRLRRVPPRTGLVRGLVLAVVTVGVMGMSLIQILEMLAGRRAPEPVAGWMDAVRPLRMVNAYDDTPPIPAERLEVVIEGSLDGVHWRPYRFAYRPSDPHRPLQIALPHNPRLDLAIGRVPYGDGPGMALVDALVGRLATNSAAVTTLLGDNPFAYNAPRHIRVNLYRYRFTDRPTREATGRWWDRELVKPLP